MNQFKKYLTPCIILFLIIGSIILNTVEINNPKTPFFQQVNTPVAEKILTKTNSFDEKLTLPINDTSVEMKISRAETSIVTVKDALTEKTSNQIYFQVFATIKNIGTKTFSFNSIPVIGVSKNNFILLAKSTTINTENKIVIGTSGILPNQNSNLMRSSLEIKPGAEISGFFLFENEVQSIQVLSAHTPYIWKTMKTGADIVGKEISSNTEVTNVTQNIRFKVIDSKSDTQDNKNITILRVSFTNSSNDEISPLTFIPKYGISIPGEVYKHESIDSELAKKYNCENLTSDTRLAAKQTKEYLIAFPKTISSIFVLPPMADDFTNIKIVL